MVKLSTVSVLLQRVGPRIRRDRLAKGWTQQDLVDALAAAGGPRYSTRISLWETRSSLPSEQHRLLLARVLDVPADRYFALSQPDDATNDSAAA
jgi:transcriptional regulator with XRE-family HTH domain